MELLGAGYIGVHGLQHGGIVQCGVDQLAGHELVAHVGYKVLGCQRATPIVSYAKGRGNVLALDALQQVLEANQVTAKGERARERGEVLANSAGGGRENPPPDAAAVRLLDLLVEMMQQAAIDGSVPVHDLRDGTVLGL